MVFRVEHTEMDIKFVYSPVHGVGLDYATEAFKRFGFSPFFVVQEQVSFSIVGI